MIIHKYARDYHLFELSYRYFPSNYRISSSILCPLRCIANLDVLDLLLAEGGTQIAGRTAPPTPNID